MIPYIRSSLVLIVSFTLVSCAHRATSLRLLDARAGYNSNVNEEEIGLFQGGKGADRSLLAKNRESARVYLHPAKLPSGDWFWGGYVTLSLKGDTVTEDEFSDAVSSFERPAIYELEDPSKNSAEHHERGSRH